MKILLVLALLLAGCAQGPGPVRSMAGVTGVSRWIDDEAGVVCWIYASGYQGGISCLPLASTKLEDQK